jgi:F-type H+-transporting ATPase subunit gamma
MANTITLKRRIGSVKNTRQITKAMELVAASKMRKAVESAHQGRAYREAAHSLMTRLTTVMEVSEHPLFKIRTVKTKLYIVVTSDRGLAGAYNANILKLFARMAKADIDHGISVQVIVVGNRGAGFIRRFKGIELLAAFPSFGDRPTANDIRPLLSTITEIYREAKTDDVQLLYTLHRSNIVQDSMTLSLLPARLQEATEMPQTLNDVTFEPSVEAVLDNVTERLLEVQIWQAMLESVASEHSMRMLAMKNATDNASDIIDDLTLEFNTARQAHITQEIAEITGGAEAMKDE